MVSCKDPADPQKIPVVTLPNHEDEGAGINNATKYVASNTLTKHEWRKSVFLNGDVVAEIKKLKQQDGPEIQVHGSGNLIQTLLAHDLVDEFWLKIFPVTLGMGKRLFDKGTIPASYTLTESKSSPSGVIMRHSNVQETSKQDHSK
jgi:dihydrofolate reductase